MEQKAVLIGATGLIGSHFLDGLKDNDDLQIHAITRRKIDHLEQKGFIGQSVYDFKDLEAIRPVLKTDILISTFGTTIRNAGSQDEFVRVDHDIPLEISKMAKEEGCKTMILVSSVGADSGSKYFYTRMKGLLEEAIKDLEFETFHIIRPSLLLGNRMEFRLGEYLSGPLAFMVPWQYRPIHAGTVATFIKYLIKENLQGNFVWEGQKLFHPE
ncbi:MAG: NAD(P)H-binding protein [Deltaproteobacteria bacterium]